MHDDRAAREGALEPDGSFIVKAPAGSGKTSLLTHRLLRLLVTVEQPEHIVAITFTRKAAEEMRERIISALALAGGPPPEDPFARHTHALASAVLAHDARLDWGLTRQPARLRIMTIDALCASLVRQMPLAAGLAGARNTVEDARELYLEAAREAVTGIAGSGPDSRAVARVLRHLDNDWGRLESLLADMLARRDQWLRPLAGGSERAVLQAAYGRLVEAALARAAALAPPAALAALTAAGRFAAAELATSGPGHPAAVLDALDAPPGTSVGELPAWQGLASLVLTKAGGWRKRLDKRDGFPARNEAASAAKQQVLDAIDELAEVPHTRAAFVDVALLPPSGPAAADWDATWAVCGALLGLLRQASAHLIVAAERGGRTDFTAVAMAALAALGEDDAPSDLALRLDYRIQHLLVDEFQDTSRTQYTLIERLTAGWTPGDGRTLFLVGDPWQSIYRFRQADVSLFAEVLERGGLGSVELQPLDLTLNFRSQAALVDVVNATIPAARAALESETLPFTPQRAVRAASGEGIAVHAAPEHDASAESAALLESVVALRTTEPDASIAVLVRSRAHLGGITSRLLEAGLPVAAREIQPFATLPAVSDLLALTRALLHPADSIAWFAVLRAPWCGLTLRSLETIARAVGDGLTVGEALADAAVNGALDSAERARARRTGAVLAEAEAARAARPLWQCVERAWQALGGPACVEPAQQLADCRMFVRLLAEVEYEGRPLTGGRIERRIAELYSLAPPAAGDAVQVMTMHRAKGLEFDHVLIPGLGRRPRGGTKPLLAWREVDGPAGAPTLLMAPLPATGDDRLYDYLRALDAREEAAESVRLLYVALTRARQCVHLFGHAVPNADGAPTPAKGSFLAMLWPALGERFAAALPAAGQAAAGTAPEARPVTLRRLSGDSVMTSPPEARARALESDEVPAPEFEWASVTAKHVGTVTHRLLQVLGETPDEARPAVLAAATRYARGRLRALGVEQASLDAAAAQVHEALERTLASERGRWLLADTHAERSSELALGALDEGVLVRAVIDRTFVDAEGRRWIVDYKTGTHAGGRLEDWLDAEVVRYRPQLERYGRIMAAVDERPISLGLYFPLLDAWRSWALAER